MLILLKIYQKCLEFASCETFIFRSSLVCLYIPIVFFLSLVYF
ncbi:hypothetical protein TcasGA2_TC033091 [Tribolium castaneum]|uniref:Uncharacterized protein n=1 Tax=Tribolium castaneum TaxID=7070 RepID=A0A139WIK0_TRICA|nr:hypothetical protein TcasGA2_TC033091 [Tribolium castaneum]